MAGQKVVSRKLALGITALCIILIVVTAGLLQSQVQSLQSRLASDKSTIASLNTNVAAMNSTITNLEGQLSLDPNRIVDGFSLVQITDTQFLSDEHPALYDNLTSWIVNKSEALNLTMVVHTGDIVQEANSTYDWENANYAMMTLYNASIPYCWNAGNHDQFFANNTIGNGNPNSSWLGGNYPAFNATIMRQKPYWVADIFDGKNTAVQFAWGNYHFMIINIEYNANQTVLDWMQTLIECNPNVNIIVATHDFLNGAGTYGTLKKDDVVWANNFEKFLNNFPNVFMTINGHAASTSPMAAFDKRVGDREEIFFNRQDLDDEQGAACARIYTFEMSKPSNAAVDVYTYQTLGNVGYLTDPEDQFSFPANLRPYTPSTVSISEGTDFLGASGYSVSFSGQATIQNYRQYGDTLTFKNLNLNGATSNATVTSVGANITISQFNPAGSISYTVSGSGEQTFPVESKPTSVNIDGSPAPVGDGWNYANGEVTVTGANSSVNIVLA